MARVLEKLINSRLVKYLRENNLIHKHQSGFLPGHSTVKQLCFLLHQWQMAIDKKDDAQVAFLELSKDYDRVAIPGLIYKLS